MRQQNDKLCIDCPIYLFIMKAFKIAIFTTPYKFIRYHHMTWYTILDIHILIAIFLSTTRCVIEFLNHFVTGFILSSHGQEAGMAPDGVTSVERTTAEGTLLLNFLSTLTFEITLWVFFYFVVVKTQMIFFVIIQYSHIT